MHSTQHTPFPDALTTHASTIGTAVCALSGTLMGALTSASLGLTDTPSLIASGAAGMTFGTLAFAVGRVALNPSQQITDGMSATKRIVHQITQGDFSSINPLERLVAKREQQQQEALQRVAQDQQTQKNNEDGLDFLEHFARKSENTATLLPDFVKQAEQAQQQTVRTVALEKGETGYGPTPPQLIADIPTALTGVHIGIKAEDVLGLKPHQTYFDNMYPFDAPRSKPIVLEETSLLPIDCLFEATHLAQQQFANSLQSFDGAQAAAVDATQDKPNGSLSDRIENKRLEAETQRIVSALRKPNSIPQK